MVICNLSAAVFEMYWALGRVWIADDMTPYMLITGRRLAIIIDDQHSRLG